ncbi:MAG: D-alanyl-D-alanine carboxypeptidase [Deltaproteobacteria bacterium]|nr:D-alanyl-D-alanine carboxypeptidase [Deltaproteobacteria bacterium]
MKHRATRASIFVFCIITITCTASLASAARAPIPVVSKDPYAGALLIDTDTGRVLFEHNADARLYPASLTKLMTFLIVIEALENKQITLKDTVTACAEAESMGGSQVYLRRGEQFSVEELLYALMIKSANDAAFALAKHVAGSRQAFIERMNQRARQLGMTGSEFHSMHGLPPSQGQKPDCTTARDIAKLCRELLRHDTTLRYTSTETRPFRTNEFIMRNHNHLLKSVDGCDGLKTGYYRAAGFSIAATAARNDRRVLAIVMCSRNRLVRDAEAKKLLLKGLADSIPAVQTVDASTGEWIKPTARADSGF